MNSKLSIAGLILGGLVLLGIIALFIMKISYGNGFARYDADVRTTIQAAKNTHSTLVQQIQTGANVDEKQAEDTVNLMTLAIRRYATANGTSQVPSLAQIIHESNLQMDPSIKKKIMDIAERGYANFAADQTTLLDLCNKWIKDMTTWPGSMFAGSSPKTVEQIRAISDGIIITKETKEMYETGIAKPVLPFENKKK